MKRTSWKTALVCSLASFVFSLGTVDLFALAPGGGHSGGKGDGHSNGGRGQSGGGGGRFNMGGGGDRGGNHAPSGGGSQQPAGIRQQPQQIINHSPTFSRPNQGGQFGHTGSRPIAIQPGAGGRSFNGVKTGAGHLNAVNDRPGLPNQVGVGTTTQRFGHNHSSIVNRPFVGNTINLNERSFHVGHSSYQPAYYRHSGYHGYWNGNRGYGGGSNYGYGYGSGQGFGHGSNYGYRGGYNSGWGWGLGNGFGYGGSYGPYTSGYRGSYGYRPFGWGLGGWGLGSLIYNSGYLRYSNPYYNNSYGSYGNYSYSQPIPVFYNSSQAVVSNDPNSAAEVLNNADAAFQQNDYDSALDIVNKGIAQYPDDAVLHEFRSLVLFAREDYQQSAATIHSVLAVGPGWDWTTLSSMYAEVAIYTKQLRALEAFTKKNPQDAASRFLLAYHYMSCGYPRDAARHLTQVVKLMPNDQVAADVLKMVAVPQAAEPEESLAQPATPRPQELSRPAPQPVAPETLVGTWNAARPDGSKFNLTLTKDALFTWSFAQKSQAAQEFSGTYSVEGNVLALERKDGGSLIAEVTPGGNTKFNFKLLGAPTDDLGLDFTR